MHNHIGYVLMCCNAATFMRCKPEQFWQNWVVNLRSMWAYPQMEDVICQHGACLAELNVVEVQQYIPGHHHYCEQSLNQTVQPTCGNVFVLRH